MSALDDSYEEIPYESSAFPQSHPGNLGVIATLFGMQPASLEGARILEIGCAGGGNLLPVAAAHPGSQCVGIDLSPGHIAEARAGVEALRLRNVSLHVMDIGAAGPGLGSFDYVIAHGVYSWVSQPVREQLMALCGTLLSPMGVAYVSYNALPGSSARSTLRELVQFHTRQEALPAQRVRGARACFAFLRSALQGREDAYARSMQEELSQLAGIADFYIAHEHLEGASHACYFHRFAAHAQQHGLQFLGEAEPQTMSSAGFSAAVRQGLREMSTSILEAEQYGDFVRNRAFRQTLLCRQEVALQRAISPGMLEGLHLAASVDHVPAVAAGHGHAEAQFRDGDGVILTVRDPLTSAALKVLREVWPASLTFAELLEKALARAAIPAGQGQAASLASALLTCYSTSRGVELHLLRRQEPASVSGYPQASALARWQASRGTSVVSLRHTNILLGPAERALLLRLDGTCSLTSLEAECGSVLPMLERFSQAAILAG